MTRSVALMTALLVAGLFLVHAAARSDAVSPGNRGLVAFGSTRGGDEDIYAVDPSSGTVTQLVNAAALERDAAWSPDGSKIAFIRQSTSSPCSVNTPCGNLVVKPIAGGAEVQLTSSAGWVALTSPAWSPNGATIAYIRSTNSDPKDVWTIPAAGGSPTQVTNTTVAEKSPDWSPNGALLVMSGGGKLWTVPAGGGTPTELTLTGSPPAVSFQEPSWGPDGRIAFFGGDVAFGETDVYVTNANGSGTVKVWDSGSGGSVYGPSWAPDGSRIVFAYGTGAAITQQLRVLNLCNGNVNTLASSAYSDNDPNWQPVLPAPSTIPPNCSTPTSSPPPTSSSPPPPSTSSSPPPSSTSSGPPPTPPPGRHVDAADHFFDADDIRIARGATVVWDGVGPSTHRVADRSAMSLFLTGNLAVGDADWATFVAAGTYRYACQIHSTMRGRIRVPITVTPARGTRSTSFEATWASRRAPSGFAYDVQIKRPGAANWRLWKDDTVRASASFRPDAGKGTYRFRARLVKAADGTHPAWSSPDSIRVR